MAIQRKPFQDRFAILPNSRYIFGSVTPGSDLLSIVADFECGNIAKVAITGIGLFAFIFDGNGPLASIDILESPGGGTVPDEVVENDRALHALQDRRMAFANFIAAGFFGRLSAKRNSSLIGANYSGQDQLTGFGVKENALLIPQTEWSISALTQKAHFFRKDLKKYFAASDSEVRDSISFVHHLWKRRNEFKYTDLQACMIMNYQAAILHKQQHFAASFTLNFAVIESLIREIFMAYGLVEGATAWVQPAKSHDVARISQKKFGGPLAQLVTILENGSLLDYYLCQRINSARELRNQLMHQGARVDYKVSGDCQTIVRDLWSYLIDGPFELNASWSFLR